MTRAFHRWPGLVAALLVTLLALSGAALSLFPAAERLAAPQAEAGLTVAELSGRIAASHPGLEQIRRAPSGRITAWWFADGQPQSAVIDPATGLDAGSADPNPLQRWLTGLHRSLFLGDAGRMVAAAGAAAMLLLSGSGILLVARRVGGWRHWFAPLRGPLAGRLHVEIARIAVVGLVLSSATALWMSASTFELLPEGASAPVFPAEVSGTTGLQLAAIPALQALPVAQLRSLSLADPADATDAHLLKTSAGSGYLDQGNGEMLSWAALSPWQSLSGIVMMLHTGRGAAVLGLLLGLMALGVPVMA
ncbi:MAG TPA: N-acetylglucosamine transferase, partial [Paracoccus solventivorans]